jgi:hypothetical protein
MAFFTLLTAVVVAGGAVLMDTILREEFEHYRNFGESFFSLVYTALGRGDFLENQSGGLDVAQFLGNIVYFMFLMFVTILLINLLIAIMNNTFESWKVQSRGMWALQFTELLHRFEIITCPPPLNLLAFLIYFCELLFCEEKLYSYRLIKGENIYDSLQENTVSKGIDSEVIHFNHFPMPYENVSVERFEPLVDLEDDIIISTEQTDEILIKNNSDRDVVIKFGKGLSSWEYVRLLHNTSVLIPRPPEDIYCVAIPCDSIAKIECKEIHAHSFTLTNNITSNNYCHSCCSKLVQDYVLTCNTAQCNFQLCLKCYYDAKIQTNTKAVGVIKKRVHKSDRWWKKKVSNNDNLNQNELVKVIVDRYLKDKQEEN